MKRSIALLILLPSIVLGQTATPTQPPTPLPNCTPLQSRDGRNVKVGTVLVPGKLVYSCDQNYIGIGTDVTGAGASVVLDLGNNGSSESSAITKITTTGDTNSIFTEPNADELRIALGNDWPKADQADALAANGANCSAGQYPLGVDAAGAVESCTADDDTPESGDFGNLTAGAGLSISTGTLTTASTESNFLASSTLVCGGGTAGKMTVDTVGTPLAYCDASGVLQYAAYSTLGNGVANSAAELSSNGSNCSAGNYPLGVDAAGAVETCTADDDTPESGDFGNLTGGNGLTNSAGTLATASSETNFISSGALTCGAVTQGKMLVHTTPLQYCDNSATPTLQYAAYGSSTGVATSATALAANPSNCAVGECARGIDASGVPEVCLDPIEATEINSSAKVAAIVGDETGTGAIVYGTGPVLQDSFTLLSNVSGDALTQVFKPYRCTTTSNTVTTCATFTLSASKVYHFEMRGQARRTGGSSGTAEDAASYSVRATYHLISGVATIIGSAAIGAAHENQAGWDMAFAAATGGGCAADTDVCIRVTGATNNNVTWVAWMRYEYMP